MNHSPAALAAATTLTFALGLGLAPTAQASTVWDQVAACESGGNWAINTGNGFYGGLQFTHSTWIGYGGGAYASNANLASRAAQIAIAQRVLAGQGPGAWPVCSRRGGLTRGNGGITVSRTASRPALRPSRNVLAVDGVMGPLTRAALARRGIHLSTVPAIKAWQHRLRISVDGRVGRVTTASMQRWLNTH